MKQTLLILIFLCTSARADIFGEDNRSDIRRGSRYNHLARSVAVGVLNSLWTEVTPIFFDLWADPIDEFMCSDEPFVKQASVSYACSGFLVGPDLLVTAGHCGVNTGEVRNSSEDYCEAYTWMFDFYAHTNTKRVPKKNVYKCKEIIYATVIGDDVGSQDFTLLRLDRPVTGRKPLKLAKESPAIYERVKMLGHPMGLPMKLTDKAEIFSLNNGRSFLTNLDAFSGNSGSPVFNDRDEVIGVLVAGNPALSTYRDEVKGCDRYNRCDENGENCQSISFNEGQDGFPNTFSEVQNIQFYKDLIQENLN
jgi:V8-like Glu-specific endopeptidase